MSVGAPSKTGSVLSGRDVRFEEGGREPKEGACWVCSRSCLPHVTHACRTCRAGKPSDWRAEKPVREEVVPILTVAERKPISFREVMTRTIERRKARKETFVTARIKQVCPCGFENDWPPAFGKHRAYCEVALGGKPKPVQAPRGGGPRAVAVGKADPEAEEDPAPALPPPNGFAVESLLGKAEPLDRAARVLEQQAAALRKIADAARAFGELPTASRAAVLERLA